MFILPKILNVIHTMIISSISYKGGVGKSTVARNLAVYFAHSDYKVCIVDADESQVTVKWSGVRLEKEKEPVIQVVGMTDPKALMGTVKQIYNDYDIVIIDSPPSYNPISVKIMLISHLILMPIKPTGRDELETAKDLLERYTNSMEMKEKKTEARFIINEFNPSPSFHKSFIAILKEIGEEYNVPVLDTYLRYRPAVYSECSAKGIGVIEYNNKAAKKEFKNLAENILKIGEEI
jgi:chromosome partitioning protein